MTIKVFLSSCLPFLLPFPLYTFLFVIDMFVFCPQTCLLYGRDHVQEMTDEPPVPVTLFCSSKKGHSLSFADFLASEGVALRIRKPRFVFLCDDFLLLFWVCFPLEKVLWLKWWGFFSREPVVQEIGEAQATSPVEKTEDQSDGGEINNNNNNSSNSSNTTHPPALDAIPFISQISLYSCPPKPYPRKMVSAEIVSYSEQKQTKKLHQEK